MLSHLFLRRTGRRFPRVSQSSSSRTLLSGTSAIPKPAWARRFCREAVGNCHLRIVEPGGEQALANARNPKSDPALILQLRSLRMLVRERVATSSRSNPHGALLSEELVCQLVGKLPFVEGRHPFDPTL